MHVLPLDSRLHSSLDSFLRLQNGSVDLSLLLGEFARDWEGHGLVSDVTVPSASHVQQDHLVGLDQLVVVDVV